tara:strand:- start:1051 stop:1206 length:156 start_codon:yes stop_codon:yes gene_type:complete
VHGSLFGGCIGKVLSTLCWSKAKSAIVFDELTRRDYFVPNALKVRKRKINL